MPKQVDHEARRQRIADAVCRIVARQGLEEVSLRHVAAEAGISMGQVQHYFTTKDEMLLSAFNTMSARVEERLRGAVENLEQPPTTRALLRTLLMAMVPTDDHSRAEAPLWIAFMARATIRPELVSSLQVSALTDFAAGLLRTAQEAGEVAESIDPELTAIALFALADGLMIRIMLDPAHTDTALAALDYQIDRVFGRPADA